MTTIRFDDGLKILATIVTEQLGTEALRLGSILRDADGRLSFFSASPLPEDVQVKLTQSLHDALGAYARTDRSVADIESFGAENVLNDTTALRVSVDNQIIRLVDRRLVGADWLRAPAPSQQTIPRVVFASLKGGVGRSTALSVTAADLASKGLRVLVVDLDLEAPGLGAILLDDNTLPEFGVLDALVENGMGGLDAAFLIDLISPSALAGGQGKIDVIPVLGKRSLANPSEIMAKISRAYLEDIGPGGEVKTILDQIRDLVDSFSDPERYDAILVDARAGLHETTAAAFLGLDAEIFLFGLDERQTMQGFDALFSHLSRLPYNEDNLPEWLNRLTLVQGKAPVDSNSRQAFTDKCHALICKHINKPIPVSSPTPMGEHKDFKDIPWDDDLPDSLVLPNDDILPNGTLAVMNDSRYQNFDPLARGDLLTEKIYQTTFGDILSAVHAIIPNISEGYTDANN